MYLAKRAFKEKKWQKSIISWENARALEIWGFQNFIIRELDKISGFWGKNYPPVTIVSIKNTLLKILSPKM